MTKQKTIKDWFTKKEWEELIRQDPSISLMAATPWQDPDNFSKNFKLVSEEVNFFPEISNTDAKPNDLGWYELQKKAFQIYKIFGPLNAAVNSKADYVAQNGFSVYSDIYEIDLFLKDLFYSYRNKLYARLTGWIIRMLTEGELFLLLLFDNEGNATVRVIEPSRIGSGGEDTGLLKDPDDASQTLWYKYKNELIPDARFILEPEFMNERTKELGDKFQPDKVLDITKRIKGGGSNFKAIGGYRRFILHWKNLTGIYEFERDTSSLTTVLEWVNLYIKAIRWGMDHKRALSAYTWVIGFEDSPAGKVAWHIWNKMTPEQRESTGLTKPLTPGSRVYLMPGMKLNALNPQIPSMSGSNQDLLNLSGAGARTPQDLFQGQTAGSTYASIKTTRPPLEEEISDLQSKIENFLRYEFLRLCFKAKTALGGTIKTPSNERLQLPETYQDVWYVTTTDGKQKKIAINRELIEGVIFTWPIVKLNDRPQETVSAFLGNNNNGIYSLGVSAETIAKRLGIQDYSREQIKQKIEQEKYGMPITSGIQQNSNAIDNSQEDNNDSNTSSK